MDPSSSSSQQEASNLKTPQMDQSDWTSSATPTSSTPSRQAFPRRLSLLQNDTASPIRASSSEDSTRKTSFTGPKPLSLASQSVTSTTSSTGSAETPRQSKRSSITYIPSPSTSVRPDEGQLSRAPSTSSASGRTRTGSISRATAGADSAARRRPSQASQANSDADDWLMNDHDASNSAARSMAERDSAKVEALFNDTGYREGITAGKLSTLQSGFDQGFNEVGATLGRQVGVLRGQVAALLLLTSSPTSTFPSSSGAATATAVTAGRKGPTRTRGLNNSPTTGSGAGASSLPILTNPSLEQAKLELRHLAKELDELTLGRLAEPDYQAMEHEREHQDGGVDVVRETQREKAEREQILQYLKQRLQSIRQMLDLRPLQV